MSSKDNLGHREDEKAITKINDHVESKKVGKSGKKNKKKNGPFRHLKKKKKRKGRKPLKKPKHFLGKIRYYMLVTIRNVQDLQKKSKKLRKKLKKFFDKKTKEDRTNVNDDDDDEEDIKVKKVHFWNLNPAYENLCGLPDGLCTPESWVRLKQFCEANYITQDTLENMYGKLKFALV